MNESASNPPKLNCPTCQKSIIWNEDYPYRPFCSHRCQLIDLGEWANESYSIPETIQNSTLDDNSDSWE